MVDLYPGAIQMHVPDANVFWEANPSYAIVLHGTAGWDGASAQDIANMFINAADRRSSHFVVGRDGTVVQCVALSHGAGANCCLSAGHDPFWDIGVLNLNTVTISIEHVHWTDDNSDPLTPAQQQSSFKLVKWICDQKHIAASHIKSHGSLDPANRSRCPGNYPWDGLKAYLANGGEQEMATVKIGQGIGSHFQDKGNGRWHCDNGFDLVGRNREYWCYYEGHIGLPKSNEIKIGNNGEVLQMFERGIQVYDPKNTFDNPPRQPGTGAPEGVYMMHIDGGDGQARIAKPLTDALNKAIAALKAQVDSLNQQLASTQNANVQALQQQIQDLTTQLTDAKSALSQIQSLAATAASK